MPTVTDEAGATKPEQGGRHALLESSVMARFCLVREDLGELIDRRQATMLRRYSPYSIGPLAAAAALFFVYAPAAFVALGMSVAWSISMFREWRSIGARSLWDQSWLQEESTLDLEEDGIRLSSGRGASFLRWDGFTIRAWRTCFVLEEEWEELAVIPKRYLSTTELLVLQNRGAAPQSGPARLG